MGLQRRRSCRPQDWHRKIFSVCPAAVAPTPLPVRANSASGSGRCTSLFIELSPASFGPKAIIFAERYALIGQGFQEIRQPLGTGNGKQLTRLTNTTVAIAPMHDPLANTPFAEDDIHAESTPS